jgi:prophage regulatory protein
MANTILRLPAVKARTGLSRSTIYLLVSDGTFPSQVSLGARAVGWVESEIDTWLTHRIAQSRQEASPATPKNGNGERRDTEPNV